MKTSDIRFTTNFGPLSLFELFARIEAGDPVELLRMQPYQRAPVVTALAIMMTALRKYATTTPIDWAAEWLSQVGDLPVLGALDQPGFFQPAILGDGIKQLTIAGLDPTFCGMNHEYKNRSDADFEDYLFALLASPWRIKVKGWFSTSGREAYSTILPSTDGSLGSEVRCLGEAYQRHRPNTAGTSTHPTSAADHFIWLRDWLGGEPVAKLPYPALIQRPVRLIKDAAVGQANLPARTEGFLDDPHVARIEGAAFKLSTPRTYDIRFQHACLFGATKYGQDKRSVEKAPILDLIEYRCIRLCGYGWSLGKTDGYWEDLYTLRSGARRLFGPATDRASELSVRALNAKETAAEALDVGVRWLLGREKAGKLPAADKARKQAAMRQFDTALAHKLTQGVLDLLAEPEDKAREQIHLSRLAAEEALAVFEIQSTAFHDPLRVARARIEFEKRIEVIWSKQLMSNNKASRPELVRQCYAILSTLQSHLSSDDRAKLRTMDYRQPPLAYYRFLAEIPSVQADNLKTERVWRAIIVALGVTRSGGRPVGRVLNGCGFPEARIQQLLAASGDRLVELIREAVRWLVSHQESSADLSTLCALGLADALGDTATRTWCRKELALDYVGRPYKPAPAATPSEIVA